MRWEGGLCFRFKAYCCRDLGLAFRGGSCLGGQRAALQHLTACSGCHHIWDQLKAVQSHGKVPGLWFALNWAFLKRVINVWREFSFLALFKTQNLARVLKLLSRAERSLAWLCCTGANPTFHSCAHCNLVLPVPPQLGGLLKGGSSSEAF